MPSSLRRRIDLALIDGCHVRDVANADTSDYAADHELDALVRHAHENTTDDEDKGAKHERALASQRPGGEGSTGSAQEGADVVEDRDGARHEGRASSHRIKPVGGYDDTVHDALIVAEEEESSRADGCDEGDENRTLEGGKAALGPHYDEQKKCSTKPQNK